MMKIYKYILSLLVGSSVVTLTSCNDSINNPSDLADGEGVLTATVYFETEETNLGKSRTNGDIIKDINDITFLFYNEEGKLVTSIYKSAAGLDITPVPAQRPSDFPTTPGATTGEFNVDHVTSTFKVPYGQYYIYAVANMDETFVEKYNTAIQTVEGLKAIRVVWNSDDIAENNQMFGYLSNANTGFATAAPLTNIDGDHLVVNGWVKRLVSKVSVAYDGSRLKDGVSIYIHNVSIRNIPTSCSLGNINKFYTTAALGDSLTGAYYQQPVQSLPNPSTQAIYYNNDGITDDVTGYDPTGTNYESWLKITKDTPVLGLKQEGGFPDVASEISDSEEALFFFENMAGDFTPVGNLTSGDESKSKVQDTNAVNKGVVGEADPDYMDGVPSGTFVEVEAYYVNTNTNKQGPIRYRFMLGQDVEYNYNAARNHYFKLTMCFAGSANSVDWHIEFSGN